jgi:hypothetical protein
MAWESNSFQNSSTHFDAQVIRTDLSELYHMDIQGAPYAYTPFCDNNREMDEFRFWKGGFWREHLRVSVKSDKVEVLDPGGLSPTNQAGKGLCLGVRGLVCRALGPRDLRA